MKPGYSPPCFARSAYSSMDSFWITAPSEKQATYRLYQKISGNKSSSKELEVEKQCTARTYMMHGRTSVRLVKIYNKMVRHSSTSNDIGLEAPAGERFPLNRIRLDPPF